jgi:hypothetical protein
VKVKTIVRRRELVKQRNLGMSLTDSVTILARKHHVTERCIYRDWQTRAKWLPALLEIGDPQAFFYDVVSQHRELQRFAALEYLKCEGENARIGALRLLRDLNLDLQDMIVARDVMTRLDRLEAQS